MIIHLLAGGPLELLPLNLPSYDKECMWVGVDRGVYQLLQLGIKPDVAFGDFDSVSEEELLFIKKEVQELRQYKPEKDETDMELAQSWAISQNPDKIRIFGATGGRLDHLFANVQLLIKPIIQGILMEIELVDRQNIIFVKGKGTHDIQRIEDKKYISFVPISTEIKGLTLRGFKYPLNDCHISLGSTLSISNELINDHGTFSFEEGILMVIRSND